MKTQSQIAERVLALAKRQAEAAEVLFQESEESPVVFKANRLHAMETKLTTGLGLRIVKGGRLGFSCTTDLSKTKELVENAVVSAKYGQVAKFEFPKKTEKAEVSILSPEVRKAAPEAFVEAGRKVIAGLLAGVPEMQCDVLLEKSTARLRLLNTAGLDSLISRTRSQFSVSGLVIGEGGLLWVSEGRSSRKLVLPDKKVAAKLAEQVRLARKIVPAPQKPLPVLFAPEVMPNLWYAVVMGVNGKTAQKGSSPLVGKIGEKLLDERMTITDDPTLDWGPASSPWDDEGVKSRKNVLFEEGAFREFLYDLQTAGLAGAVSTGSARRSFSSLPQPSVTNLVVKPGKDKLEDLLEEMDEGVVIYNVIGGGQSNLLAGDFSLNIGLGYKIEKGKIAGRVKDVMVAGNVYSLFKDNLLALSKETEWAGNIKTPAALFKDVSLASGKK